MNIVEIYMLCKSRSKEFAVAFLENFAPNREPCSDEYPYPEYEEPAKHVYDDVEELLGELENSKGESYSLYWNGIDMPKVKNAMLFYTEDGQMVAGLAVEQNSVEKLFSELALFSDAKYGYVSFDSPPPETKDEFVQYCRNSDQVRMVDGEMLIS